ncbi:MAG: hypothetical protein H0U56_05225 [Methylibium sp.]|uniref:hypothetical protein n=1 Tax=Methylibium sp. TaxID=2067992 RepID=UPI0017A74108|nr:hypothetical protein [Methylibium sp.]MBA2722291.1 hypothetical protein [Methylibium sp.]MBA3590461.1 hypothetical protein [Methylibium sp.]
MSHIPTLGHALKTHPTLPRVKAFYGILSAATAAAVIASITIAVLSRTPAASNENHMATLPSAPVPLDVPPGTSVPDASTVFHGRDMPVEEPVPTF